MLDWRITSHHPSDMLGTSIGYCSANLYHTYTMYHPPDVCWHVLNDTMSQYYLRHYRIFGLNALFLTQTCILIGPFCLILYFTFITITYTNRYELEEPADGVTEEVYANKGRYIQTRRCMTMR